ncbi:MAG: 2-hydroxyacyl-CoA dehydratase family protein [Lachnospiraceae bacterium]|nr:2-hydroxyacyl-CoA dehydratase family protein [Lachnospiraceae bacterium]
MKILSFSGFVPEQICDTVRFTQYTGDRNISHYCGYASDFISRVLKDDSIDGAVYPRTCDSTRIISSYLSDSGKFHFGISIPPAGAVGADAFLASSFREYKEALEKHFDISIGDDVIRDRAEKIDRRNACIRKLCEERESHSFADHLGAIHGLLEKPLSDREVLPVIRKCDASDRKVFVIGSFLSNIKIAGHIDEAGLTVVGDSLPESGRLASVRPVKPSGDIFLDIARSMLSMRLSPTQDSFRQIMETDMEEIGRSSAKGVIYITQKYCEPYDYLYSIYKDAAAALGVPVLRLQLNDTEDDRKVSLALEAFADTL